MFKSVVKVCGSTVKLQLILDVLSAVDVYKRQVTNRICLSFSISFNGTAFPTVNNGCSLPYIANSEYSSFTVWTTRVSNPV